MLVRIGGIAGIGKTTIIKELLVIGQESGLPIREAPLREILRELAGVKTVEEYKALSEEIRGSFYPESERQIYELDRVNPSTVWVHDGRFAYFNQKSGEYRIRPVVHDDSERLLAIAILVAKPEVILSRRIKDYPIRNDRHLLDVDSLKARQEKEVMVALLQAKEIGVPIRILSNGKSDEISKVADDLFSFVKKCLDDKRE